jgi:protein-disulfide isomerase
VREHLADARQSGVRSTPTFFVNGAMQDVSFGLQALHQRVEQALR